ncbi:MAG: hypothetical protein AAB320_09745 [Elusimicrobiota bacterium]
MNNTLFVALLLAVAPAVQAQTALSFENSLNRILLPFQPKDAFAGVGACGIVDAKTLRPWTHAEALATLAPCLREVSQRYGTNVSVASGFVPSRDSRGILAGIVLMTGQTAIGSPLLLDLNDAIARRGGRLLGFPARVGRDGDGIPARSRVQGALDRCMLPMVVRKIESSEDFIKIFGRCITQDSEIKVSEIQAAVNRPLAVTLLTDSEGAAAESLNGSVIVNTGSGPVEISVLAYPKALALP